MQGCDQAFFNGVTSHTQVLCAASFKQRKFKIVSNNSVFLDLQKICWWKFCCGTNSLQWEIVFILAMFFQWKNICWSNFYTNCSVTLDCIPRWARKELKLLKRNLCKGKSIASSGELVFDKTRRRLSLLWWEDMKLLMIMFSEISGVIQRIAQKHISYSRRKLRINPDIKVLMEVKKFAEYMSLRAAGSVKAFLSQLPINVFQTMVYIKCS